MITDREILARQYQGLVYHVAHQLSRRFTHMRSEDLVGAGAIGLLQALDRFDASRGFAFSTYAMRRIRGAMLDDLRRENPWGRVTAARRRRHGTTIASLEQRTGRRAAPVEVAEALGLDLTRYWAERDSIERQLVPLDADRDAAELDDALLRSEQADRLQAAIGRLPERQRAIVVQHYYEGKTLREIARGLGVTGSRASQLLKAAVTDLGKLLRDDRVADLPCDAVPRAQP